MGFSYRKSFKAGPFRVTASKSGISYSAGVKGARITKRANGRVSTRVSAPGTGLSYTTGSGKTRKTAPAKRMPAVAPGRTAPDISTVVTTPPPPGSKPLAFKGYLGTVTLHPDWVDIERTFMGKITGNRSQRIPWQQVAAVDFRSPNRAHNGYIHFVVPGDPRGLTSTGNGNRLAATARQPHAIMFTWQQRTTYEQLHGLLVSNARSPKEAVQTVNRSVADELAKLGQLMQQGILSADEFAAAKARLLGQ